MEKSIGRLIADARKAQNLPQSGLAKLLFVSPQAVGKWERDESPPDILVLRKIAEVLNISPNELFGKADEKCFEGCTCGVCRCCQSCK